jgi:hypothetical protein
MRRARMRIRAVAAGDAGLRTPERLDALPAHLAAEDMLMHAHPRHPDLCGFAARIAVRPYLTHRHEEPFSTQASGSLGGPDCRPRSRQPQHLATGPALPALLADASRQVADPLRILVSNPIGGPSRTACGTGHKPASIAGCGGHIPQCRRGGRGQRLKRPGRRAQLYAPQPAQRQRTGTASGYASRGQQA